MVYACAFLDISINIALIFRPLSFITMKSITSLLRFVFTSIALLSCFNIYANNPPQFVRGSSRTVSVCATAANYSLDSVLRVLDLDAGQTIVLSIHSYPVHGTLAGFGYTVVSTGDTLMPVGLQYTLSTGYVGADSFKIRVFDGIDTSIISIIATTNLPARPTTAPIQYCNFSSAVPLSAGGTSLLWYSSAVGGTGSTTAPIPSTAVVGQSQQYVSQTIGGCESLRDSINIVTKPLPIVSVSPTSVTICSGNSTSLTATGALTYSWSPSTGLNSTTGAVVMASPTSTRTYFVNGTDSNGCSNTITRIVNVNPSPDDIVITGLQPVTCIGVQTTLTCSPGSGLWSSNNAGVASINGLTGVVSAIDTGSVVISYTLPTGCFSKTNMSVHPYDYHLGTHNTCIGHSITIIDSATLFPWGFDLGNSLGTHYSNYVYSTGGGCQVDFIVKVNPYPSRIYGDSVVCLGTTTTLTNDSLGTWSSTNPSVATISPSGAMYAVSVGSAIISFTPSTNCARAIHVTVNPLPVISLSATSTTICVGQSANLYASVGLSYSWSPSAGLSSTNSSSVFASPSSSVVYTVVGTDGNGCIKSDTTRVIVNPLPTISVSPTSSTICSGQNITLGGSGGISYTWAPNTALSSTTGSSVIVHPTTSTMYTVTGRDINGCTNNATANITTNPLPPISISPTSATICFGQSITLNASGGVSYSWSPSLGLSTTAGPSVIASPSVTTTYNATALGSNGCSASLTRIVSVNPIPNVAAIADQTTCNNTSTSPVTFTGAVPSTSYSWTNSNSTIGLVSSGTGNIPAFIATNSASVAVTATITVTPTANTCTGTPQTFTITVKPSPNLSTVSNQQVCNSNLLPTIHFSAIGVSGYPTTYTWTNTNGSIGLPTSGSGDTISFLGTNSGVVPAVGSVSVTPSADGCFGLAQSFSITVNPTPSVTPQADLNICNNTTSSPVTFSGTIVGTTYNWTNSNATIGLASSGIGDIPAFTATNNSAVVHVGTITVTPSAYTCQGNPISFNFSINPTPAVMPITNMTACKGAVITPLPFSSTVTGSTYSWTNSNTTIGLLAAGTNNIAAFTGSNPTSTTALSTVLVTPTANSCTGPTQSFSISVFPTPSVTAVANQTACNGTAVPSILFSGPVVGTSYSWINSDNSIGLGSSGIGDITSFLATNTSSVTVVATLTVTPTANGCIGSNRTFSITVTPAPTVTPVLDRTFCANTTTAVIPLTGAVSGTVYSWSNIPGGIGLASTGTGDIPAFTASNSGSSTVSSTITIVPSAFGCTGAASTITITVKPVPTLNSVAGQTVCANTSTTPILYSGTAIADSPTYYNWTNSDATINLPSIGTGNIPAFIAHNTGTSNVISTVTVTPVANSCAGSPQSFSMTVKPKPTIDSISDQTVCNNTATVPVTFTGTVSGTVFSWTNNNIGIGLGSTGSATIPAFIATNGGINIDSATITASASANGCLAVGRTFKIIVKPAPTLSVLADQSICDSANTSAIAFSGTAVNGYLTVYNWTNSNTSIGLAGTGTGDITPFRAVNVGVSPVVATVVVTPVGNMCNGNSRTLSLTVNPKPTVSAVTSQVICNGLSTTLVTFNGAVTGSSFSWSNNNASIGLTTSGTGNIAPFPTTNPSNIPVVAAVTVLPSANGCSGLPQSFNITVNPTPNVSTVPNQTLCNGSSTTLIALTGAVIGTVYNWSNNNNTIGLPGNGTGSIAAFTGINSSSVAVTASVTVSPEANTCIGSPLGFTYLIKPTPTVLPITALEVCNNAPTGIIAFGGSPVSGYPTVYSWTNSDTSIGLGINGSGNIPSFTALDTTHVRIISSLSVTPSANGCSGNPQMFTVTVKPTPTVAPASSQIVCNNTSTNPISFSGLVIGTTYQWTNSNSTIGLGGSGAGDIGAFTTTNSSSVTVTSTVSITPTASLCIGNSTTLTINVKPSPTVVGIPSQIICNGDTTSLISFSGNAIADSPTTYNWTNSNVGVGLPSIGSGDITPFAISNASTSPTVANIVVTPIAAGCSGASQAMSITANPTPTVLQDTNQTACNGSAFATIPFSGNVVGTTYNWTNSNATIGLGSSGSGDINSFVGLNTTTVIVTSTVTVTPMVNGCYGSPKTIVLTVKPTPTVSSITDQTVCNGASTTLVTLTGSPISGSPTGYTWINSNIAIGLGASGAGNIPSFVGSNSGTVPNLSTITVTPSANGCSGLPASFGITINPTPTVMPIASQVVCNNSNSTPIAFAGTVASTIFDWTNSNSTIGISSTGTGNIGSFTVLNNDSVASVAIFTVVPTASTCIGLPQTFTISATPTPNVYPIAGQSVCNGIYTTPIIFNSSVSGTQYNWTNSNSSIGLASTGSNNIGAFPTVNGGTSITTSTISVTPTINSCSGSSVTLTITVKPTPNVVPVTSQTVCNNLPTTTTSFSGSVSGTAFSWVNNTPSIGLVTGGLGAIPSFTALNTGNVATIATVTVTPAANGCAGPTQSYSITVNPTPSVVPTADQSICNNASTFSVNFSGSVTGSAYHWTNAINAIGLGSSGSGNISSFTGINLSDTTVIANVRVVPDALGCLGGADTFSYTIKPTPSVSFISNASVCNNATLASTHISGPVAGTVYNWVNNNNTIGLASNGSGDITPFVAVNGSSVATIASITVTPSALGCIGVNQVFTITVKPTPSVFPVVDQTVCNNTSTTSIHFTGIAIAGYSTLYNWSNSNAVIGLPVVGVGDIIAFNAINIGSVSDSSTITITPSADGCNGLLTSLTIKVNPSPDSISGDNAVCVGSSISLQDITVGGIWNTSNPAIASVSPIGVVSGLTQGSDTVSYVLSTGCLIRKAILINPLPSPIIGPDSVCANASIFLFDYISLGTWSTGNPSITTINATGTLNGVHPGIDTVYYTLSTGCKVSMPVKVNSLPSPLFGDSVACVGSPIILTDSLGATMYSVNPVAPGILTVTLSTTSACSSHVSILVNPLPLPILGTTGLCLGTSSQLYDSVAGGGWSSSDTSVATISTTGLVYARAVGTSTITYTLATGCYRTASVTVNNLFIISGVQLIHPLTCNGITGAIKVLGVGSLIAYNVNYLKNGIPHLTIKTSDAAGDLLLDSLTAGNYTNVSVSLGGCTSNYVSGLLVDPPKPSIPHLSANSPLCIGTTLNLTSSDSTSGVTFTWSGPGGYSSSFQNTSISTVVLSDSGYYTVSAGINNCYSSDSVMVHMLSVPDGSSITGSQLVCQSATTLFTDSVLGGHWSVTNNHATINSAGVLMGASYGVDTVLYVLSNMCGSDTNRLAVVIDRVPVIDSISAPSFVCVGSSVSVSDLTSGGSWLMSNGHATIDSAGHVMGISPGTDTVQYIVANTCGIDTVHKLLSIIQLPVAGHIVGPIDVCIGSNILLSDTSLGGVWSSGNPGVATISAAGLLHGISFGNVVIRYTVTNVCGIAYTTDTVTVKQLPFAGVISGSSSICVDASAILHSTVLGGSWSIPSSGVVSINTTGLGSDSVWVSGVSAGISMLRYVVSNTCGFDTATFYITVNPIPSLSSSLTPTSVCSGSTFTYIPTSSYPGAYFSWVRPTVPQIANIAGFGIDSISETLIVNGALPSVVTYNVTVSALGCSNIEDVLLTVNPIPSLNSSLNLTICSDVAINYLATSATPTTSFVWSRMNVAGISPAMATGTSYISESLTNTTDTGIVVVYTFTLSAAGCMSTENVSVLVETQAPAPPKITTMSPSYLCLGTMYQNFGAASVPPSGIKYTWTANGAEVWATGIDDQYCLVNFKYPGFTWVTLSSSYTGYTCKTRDSFVVLVGDNITQSPEVIYHHPDFVCLFNPEWTYQWGYDDVGTLDSSLLVGETNQDYYNDNPDFTNKYYWVITTYKDCMQKTYLRVPTLVNDITSGKLGRMTISPNPNNGQFNVTLSSDFTESGQLVVTNLLGQQVLHKEVRTNGIIKIELDETGIYMLSIITQHGRVTDKVIVQR